MNGVRTERIEGETFTDHRCRVAAKEALEKRRIGSFEVSTIGLGCMSLSHAYSVSRRSHRARTTMRPGAFFDVAGTAFTSDVYSNGSTFNVGAVPEPSTWALMLMGVFGLGAVLRSSRRRNVSALAAI
jgi:hypothetical protein